MTAQFHQPVVAGDHARSIDIELCHEGCDAQGDPAAGKGKLEAAAKGAAHLPGGEVDFRKPIPAPEEGPVLSIMIVWRARCGGKIIDKDGKPGVRGIGIDARTCLRSEERRVGKECRSAWSLYTCITR